jgi:hypothetical protein
MQAFEIKIIIQLFLLNCTAIQNYTGQLFMFILITSFPLGLVF